MFKYRPEIDGLRAIAVLPVMLFHAGSALFPGGFVGVDVFFTISGYLITSIILDEQNKNNFSLATFYSRRVKRILPPLFTVLIFVASICWVFAGPDLMIDVSRSISHIVTFTSNIYFYKQSGYFDTSTELKPLFHTWSLSVEEQFYVFFPLLLIVTQKLNHRRLFALLLVISIFSLGYAQYTVYDYPSWTYYMLPSRTWELLAGSMVAVFLFQREKQIFSIFLSEILSFLGLFMIFISMILFNKQTPYPSGYTLLPIIGSALILLSSTNAPFFVRLLGGKIPVGIGLISYSLYLWHQPLLTFFRQNIQESISPLNQVLIIALSFMLSALTWKYIEQPTRKSHWPNRKILVSALCASVAFFIYGKWGKKTHGFEFRLPSREREIYAFKSYQSEDLYRQGQCFLNPEQSEKHFSAECILMSPTEPRVLLWGDSHSASLYHGLHKVYPYLAQLNASGCPPLHKYKNPDRIHCYSINDDVLKKISQLQPQKIILASNWLAYLKESDMPLLRKTLNKLSQLPQRPEIILLGGLPQWNPSLVDFMLEKKLALQENVYVLSPELKQIRTIDERIKSLLIDFPHVRFISLIDMLCKEDACLATVKIDNTVELLTWDYAHLTKNGSLYIALKISELLNQ